MKRASPIIVCLAAFLAILPIADAAYQPDQPYNCVNGSTIPVVGVLIATGATIFGGAEFSNQITASSFLQVYDRTSTPSAGATPIWSTTGTAANLTNSMVAPPGGILFKNGIWLIISKSGPSYSVASTSSDNWFGVYVH